MKLERPFSVDEFLEKLMSCDPDVALDPTVQKGLEKLAAAIDPLRPRRKPRLLLVDDDDSDVAILARALYTNDVAMEVVRVSDGEQAMAYFEGRGVYADRLLHPLPSLTILDLKMPYLDGLGVLRRLRAHPDLEHSPIIVLTGSDDEKDFSAAHDLNISAYIFKPPTLEALVRLVSYIKAAWIDRLPIEPQASN